MCASCIPEAFAGRLRRAVLQIAPKFSVPSGLPLYKRRPLPTRSKSTLLQMLIPLHFNFTKINTYKKPGEGVPSSNPKVLQLVTTHTSLCISASLHPYLVTSLSRTCKSHGITSFADPHHLTPIESNLCKKGGRGRGRLFETLISPKLFHSFPQSPVTNHQAAHRHSLKQIRLLPRDAVPQRLELEPPHHGHAHLRVRQLRRFVGNLDRKSVV